MIQLGKNEARTANKTCPPRFTAPLLDNCTVSGINLRQLLGLLDEPPLQNHPGYVSHVLEQPSPALVFPSSHCCSNLIPSPQIYVQLTTD